MISPFLGVVGVGDALRTLLNCPIRTFRGFSAITVDHFFYFLCQIGIGQKSLLMSFFQRLQFLQLLSRQSGFLAIGKQFVQTKCRQTCYRPSNHAYGASRCTHSRTPTDHASGSHSCCRNRAISHCRPRCRRPYSLSCLFSSRLCGLWCFVLVFHNYYSLIV